MPPQLVPHIKPDLDPRGVIAVLEEFITRCKAGEFEAVILVGIASDGFVTRSSGLKSNMHAIGALACAQSDLIKICELP